MAKKTYELIINDEIKLEVKQGENLLEPIVKQGIFIPSLCYNKKLHNDANCRLCIVEIEVRGKRKVVTSCNYPVKSDLKVWTNTEKITKHRKLLVEMYLNRFPNVEIIQGIAQQIGAGENKYFQSELTDNNEKACILCGNCVWACQEFVLEEIIDFAGRGYKRHIAMPFGEVDNKCVGCTSCAYVCPTEAIQVVDDLNRPDNPLLIRNHGMKVNAEMATLDSSQCCMREVGTANIVEVMDRYDLLPVNNYKYGSHHETPKMDSMVLRKKYFTQNQADACWKGCSMACAKAVDGFEPKTGPYKGDKVVVDGPEYETSAGCSNMGCFDPEFVIEFNFYCDTYGIDTISMATATAFAMECFEEGLLTLEDTGGKHLVFGNGDAVLECLHEMSRGKGFGVRIGQGIRVLKEELKVKHPEKSQWLDDIGMEVKGLEYSEYVSKESLAQQAGYTLAVKGPQHDEAWLIFMDMVNNQIPSFEDKAEALYYFPLFRTWFGLMGLCKIVWNDVVPADNAQKYPPQEAAKIPEHVQNYWRFFQGMTGQPLDEKGMLDQSARVHNLQKIMNLMMGYGKRKDDMPPYRAVGPVTEEEYLSREKRYDKQLKENLKVNPEKLPLAEKMRLTREYRYDQYNKVVDAAYKRRGWNEEGVPTVERLKELGIDLPELVEIVKEHLTSC